MAQSNIRYKVDPFDITSTGTFKLLAPELKSFSPSTGPGGTVVTIRGKYFGSITPVVKFGTITASATTSNDSTIIATVPQVIAGPVQITVTIGQQSVISANNFIITNPVFGSFSPPTGTFNDEVTITGQNLSPTTGNPIVYFGTISATVVSATANSIVAKVPVTVDSIPVNIKVTVGSNSSTSADKFVLSPQEIYSVNPSTIIAGQDITITGRNFSPVVSQNQVSLDVCNLTVKSSTATQIIATVPLGLPRGTFKLKVVMNGYTRVSSTEFPVNSQWLRIPCPVLKTYVSGSWFKIVAGTIQNGAYLCSVRDNGATYKFDPSNNSFSKLLSSPNFNISQNPTNGAVATVCQDTFYIIAGLPTSLAALSKNSETWQNKSVSPISFSYCLMFSLNNKIFHGNYTEFDVINPAANYSKTNLGKLPGSGSTTASFTIGTKGYVLFPDNSFWQFDANNYQWTRLANFTGSARLDAVSFVIAGIGYIGTGSLLSSSKTLNDIWKYDPLTNQWTFVSYMPNPRYFATAFTINNKAYIGYGINNTNVDYNDFYEFDPNYPVK